MSSVELPQALRDRMERVFEARSLLKFDAVSLDEIARAEFFAGVENLWSALLETAPEFDKEAASRESRYLVTDWLNDIETHLITGEDTKLDAAITELLREKHSQDAARNEAVKTHARETAFKWCRDLEAADERIKALEADCERFAKFKLHNQKVEEAGRRLHAEVERFKLARDTREKTMGEWAGQITHLTAERDAALTACKLKDERETRLKAALERAKQGLCFYTSDDFPWSEDSEYDNGHEAEEALAEIERIEKGGKV